MNKISWRTSTKMTTMVRPSHKARSTPPTHVRVVSTQIQSRVNHKTAFQQSRSLSSYRPLFHLQKSTWKDRTHLSHGGQKIAVVSKQGKSLGVGRQHRQFSNQSSLESIFTIDCNYMNQKNYAAAYLIKEGKKGAFIDNNTNHAIGILAKTLQQADLTPDQIEYIIVTHIHLDHAGGTSKLAELCPNARVICHPRAQRHLVDPSRLIAGVKAVYGEDRYHRMYGEIKPIPEARVQSAEDYTTLLLNTRKLQFLHTRGHAKHHFVVHDKGTNSVFSGDAFGVSYLPLLRRGRLIDNVNSVTDQDFIFPSSSPSEFEPEEAHKAVDRIVRTGCDRVHCSTVFLTHFGVWDNPKEGGTQLHNGLHFLESLKKQLEHEASQQGIHKRDMYGNHYLQNIGEEQLTHWFQEQHTKRGLNFDQFRELLATDIELNVQGLLVAAATSLH